MNRRGNYPPNGDALIVECGTKTVYETVKDPVKDEAYFINVLGWSPEKVKKVFEKYGVYKPGYRKEDYLPKGYKGESLIKKEVPILCEIPILKHPLLEEGPPSKEKTPKDPRVPIWDYQNYQSRVDSSVIIPYFPDGKKGREESSEVPIASSSALIGLGLVVCLFMRYFKRR